MTKTNEPKRILIIDDDDAFRDSLGEALKKGGYKVISACDGEIAQQSMGTKAADAVISDIHMPGQSGTELLKIFKKDYPTVPFILMTGFTELQETKEAHELGASGFVAKPFRSAELLAILKDALDKAEGLKAEIDDPINSDDQYCKLNIDDFISGKDIKYDIFVRFSAEKYVKIAHQGEDLWADRIKAYKEKKIRYLYLRKDDFRRYVGMNVAIAPAVKSSNAIDKKRKVAFLRHTSEVIMEQLFFDQLDEEGFQNAKAVVESTVDLATDNAATTSLLDKMNTTTDFLYSHSLGVSLYSVMIARELKWTSWPTIYKVSMGALFHDIGKKEIDRKILDKPRRELNADEMKIYESHATRGLEILASLPSVPSDVLQIVGQHHENCLGLGYPLALTKNRIHPMARLVSVANAFCEQALKNPNSAGMSPAEAINRMITMNVDRFESSIMHALVRLFKWEAGEAPVLPREKKTS